MRDVELLAPGGDVNSVKAAILAGANAVFLGVSEFNARKRAKNITMEELADLVKIAHAKEVKIFITLNTLLTEAEFPRAIALVEQLILLSVDALIVQDYGLLSVLVQYSDQIELHASTQMTTHSASQIEFLANVGVKQVNFARELSLHEIESLHKVACAKGVKSEVFVHGAYCVSYSGQCYFSSTLYGMSGNKGTCVQPCRRDFSGEKVSNCTPFNLKDNSAYASVGTLIDAGADSLKIEGRVKSAEYVYTVVGEYRRQVDRFLQGAPLEKKSKALQSVFHRDFTDGYLQNDVSKEMFTPKSKDQSFEKVGTVVMYSADKRELKLKSKPLRQGAELNIRDKHNNFVCKGRVKRVLSDNSYHFIIEDKMKGRIYKGFTVYQKPEEISDAALDELLDSLQVPEEGIDISVQATLGKPLSVCATYKNRSHEVCSSSVLEEASARPLTIDTIKEKLGKLGGSSYSLGSVHVTSFDENLFLPIKELNEMKREMIALIDSSRETQKTLLIDSPDVRAKSTFKNKIALFINEIEDLSLAEFVDEVLFEVSYSGIETLEKVIRKHPAVIPWFQPILNDDELTQVQTCIIKNSITRIVSEHSGLAHWAKENGIRVIMGSHLNCTNSSAVQAMKTFFNAEGVLLSSELSAEQLKDIPIPDTVDLWFPLIEHKLLMNSKQCLVRNTLNCPKVVIDAECLDSCNRSAFVKEGQQKEIVVMKRAGFHNQIFASKMRYNKSEYMQLQGRVDYWLCDLRLIPSKTQLKESKEELLQTVRKQLTTNRECLLSQFTAIESRARSALQ